MNYLARILFEVRRLLALGGPLLVAASAWAAASAAEPDAGRVHAWYRSEGLKSRGADVTEWENVPGSPSARSLTRIVGSPRVWKVQTPKGEQAVVRLDGKSALWAAQHQWGSLGAERTVIALVRLARKADGFLFDGSTNSGMTRARVHDGQWQAGVQPPPIKNAERADAVTQDATAGAWQMHAFVFRKTPKGTEVTHRLNDRETTTTVHETSPLNGLILGANVGAKYGLACDIAEVIIYDRAVGAAELREVAAYFQAQWGSPVDLPAEQQPQAETIPDDPRLFRTVVRKRGDDKIHTYRIPGLAATPHGTLVAVFDIRHKSSVDLPGDIDVGMMRSTDNGETWSEMQRIMDFDVAVPGSHGNGVGDPAILVDRTTGTIFVAALWSKGNRAWLGSGPGWTPEETGQVVICKSTDDGVTWSKPVSITSQVKRKEWQLCFQGPGNGIQTQDGTLVFPAQYKSEDKVPHSCFIASTDGGETWDISPAAVPGNPPTSESAIAELTDGSLLLSMRNESRTGKRVWARWEWKDTLTNGQWSEHWFDVVDPTCMASLIRHPRGVLLLSNPNNTKRRDHLTIRASHDSGKTWSEGQLLDPGSAMYSCMTVLKDGRIGILYENGDAAELVFVRFPLDWVLEADKHPVFRESMLFPRRTFPHSFTRN